MRAVVLLLSAVFLVGCGADEKSNSYFSCRQTFANSLSRPEANLEDYIDGSPGSYGLVKIQQFMGIKEGLYFVAETAISGQSDTTHLQPRQHFSCGDLSLMPEGYATSHSELAFEIDRKSGDYSQLFRTEFIFYGPNVPAKNEYTWSLDNILGNVFTNVSEGGEGGVLKGRNENEFMFYFRATEPTELGTLEILTIATFVRK